MVFLTGGFVDFLRWCNGADMSNMRDVSISSLPEQLSDEGPLTPCNGQRDTDEACNGPQMNASASQKLACWVIQFLRFEYFTIFIIFFQAAESGLVKIKNISAASNEQNLLTNIRQASAELLQPLILGCSSKNARLVQVSLQAIQKMVQHRVIESVSPCFYAFWNTPICANPPHPLIHLFACPLSSAPESF